MNWNIEHLSATKVKYEGFTEIVSTLVTDMGVDILVITELSWDQASTTLSNIANAIAKKTEVACRFAISQRTANECYGFIITNPDLVKPVFPVLNGNGVPKQGGGYTEGLGSKENPLRNINDVTYKTAENPDLGVGVFPLVDLYAQPKHPREDHDMEMFPGQPLGTGSYREGLGYRLPTMALFFIHSSDDEKPPFLLPIVVCHFASGQSAVTRDQVACIKYLHIAELFSSAGKVDNIDDEEVPVTDLMLTGDFNLDFTHNLEDPETPIEELVTEGYKTITSAHATSGTTEPNEALPGSCSPFDASGDIPVFDGLRKSPPVPPGETLQNYVLGLKAAVTWEDTIMMNPKEYLEEKKTNPDPDIYTACFDNMFFGGTHLTNHDLVYPKDKSGNNEADAGIVIKLPNHIVQADKKVKDNDFSVKVLAESYLDKNKGKDNYRHLDDAGSLYIDGTTDPLTTFDKLVGARLISDHLPVILTFEY